MVQVLLVVVFVAVAVVFIRRVVVESVMLHVVVPAAAAALAALLPLLSWAALALQAHAVRNMAAEIYAASFCMTPVWFRMLRALASLWRWWTCRRCWRAGGRWTWCRR